MDTADVVEFDRMVWGNLPRTADGAWWRIVAGAAYLPGRFTFLALRGLSLRTLA